MKPEHKCTKCGESKPDSSFPYGKGIRHSWCRDCNNAAKREYRRKRRETIPRKKRIAEDYLTEDGKVICSNCSEAHPKHDYQDNGGGWCRKCKTKAEAKRRRSKGISKKKFSKIQDGKKLCLHCNSMKILEDFPPAKRGIGKVGSYCKTCYAEKYYSSEKGRKYTRAYRKRHRERHLALHRVRMRERRTNKRVLSDGTVTDGFLKKLYSTETCYYCREYICPKDRTADHKIPLSRNGPHSANNLVMACFPCNSSKRALTDKEFIQKQHAIRSQDISG